VGASETIQVSKVPRQEEFRDNPGFLQVAEVSVTIHANLLPEQELRGIVRDIVEVCKGHTVVLTDVPGDLLASLPGLLAKEGCRVIHPVYQDGMRRWYRDAVSGDLLAFKQG